MFGLDAFLSTLSPAQGLNIASTAFNIFGGSQKASGEAALYDYEAGKASERAGVERGLGEVRAARMRKAGKSDVSQAHASYAASGVDVGSGSVQEVEGELSRRIELDSLSAMLEGRYRGYAEDTKASQFKAAADNTRRGRAFSVGSSLLGGLTRNAQIGGWGAKSGASSSYIDAGSAPLRGGLA